MDHITLDSALHTIEEMDVSLSTPIVCADQFPGMGGASPRNPTDTNDHAVLWIALLGGLPHQ